MVYYIVVGVTFEHNTQTNPFNKGMIGDGKCIRFCAILVYFPYMYGLLELRI
jgi:hypothetical protein